jgi:hypothetical protein
MAKLGPIFRCTAMDQVAATETVAACGGRYRVFGELIKPVTFHGLESA